MKKTVFAIALLLGLAALSFWNLHHLHELTGGLCREVETVRRLAREGEAEAAAKALDAALTRWLAADGYTHIFIRHSEIDAASDIFYDLRGDLAAGDLESADAGAEKLLYHLQSIDSMERPDFKSVF